MSANRLKIKNINAKMKTKIWTVGISVPNIDSKANLPNPLIAKQTLLLPNHQIYDLIELLKHLLLAIQHFS